MGNVIVIDLETKNTFDDVGNRNPESLDVSVVGLYSYEHNKYGAFYERHFPRVDELLSEAELVVGFNTHGFDFPVLQKYLKTDLSKINSCDMLVDISIALGHTLPLDSIAMATLDEGKIGDGLKAVEYWRTGDLKSLEKYCLKDVEVTRKIFEYGVKNGFVNYHPKTRKKDKPKLDVAVYWDEFYRDLIEKNEER